MLFESDRLDGDIGSLIQRHAIILRERKDAGCEPDGYSVTIDFETWEAVPDVSVEFFDDAAKASFPASPIGELGDFISDLVDGIGDEVACVNALPTDPWADAGVSWADFR